MTIHVPPQVVSNPKLLFLGEAPSDEENIKKQPLVGPTGRIFNAQLRSASIDRSQCGITNVFDEQLPENEVANWCWPTLQEAMEAGDNDLPPIGKAGFLKSEHRWHLHRLMNEIRFMNPTVIVPLGNTALWALTGHTNIMSYRGSAQLATKIVPGKKIVPAIHPAAIIHSDWKYFLVTVGDFITAADEAARGPELFLPHRELLIEPSLEEIRDYVPRLLASDLLSCDIEGYHGNLDNIGFAPDAEHAINIPFVDLRQADRNYWRTPAAEVEALRIVKRVLESPTPKVGQNFSNFDAYVLLKRYGIGTRNLIHDTRLMHFALYPEMDKSLEFMGNSYTQQGPWKIWGSKGKGKRDDR